jgi:hypothetical protein
MAPTRDGRKKNTYCRLREKGEGPAELSAYDRFCIWLTGASLDNSSLTGASVRVLCLRSHAAGRPLISDTLLPLEQWPQSPPPTSIPLCTTAATASPPPSPPSAPQARAHVFFLSRAAPALDLGGLDWPVFTSQALVQTVGSCDCLREQPA